MDTNHDEIIRNKAMLISQKIDATIDKCVDSIYNVAKCAVLPDDPAFKNKSLDEDAIKLCLPDKEKIREYLEEQVYSCIDEVAFLTKLKKLHLVTFEK